MLLAPHDVPRYHFLDISIDALAIHDLNALATDGIANGKRIVIGNHNLHSVYLFHKSEAMRAFYGMADYVHADGMSIVLLARLLGLPLETKHRTGYLDWLPELLQNAQDRHWRIFYLGSRPGVLEEGMAALLTQWPGLQIEGHHGYFDKSVESAENAEILRQINHYKPDVLFVGMGMPLQERWIAENLEQLPQCCILACGALLDYVAGAIPTPPRWLGQFGLEWAFRLASEPRRLAHRYLIEPWTILMLIARSRLSPTHSVLQSKPDTRTA